VNGKTGGKRERGRERAIEREGFRKVVISKD
jgi:hypothetical protein